MHRDIGMEDKNYGTGNQGRQGDYSIWAEGKDLNNLHASLDNLLKGTSQGNQQFTSVKPFKSKVQITCAESPVENKGCSWRRALPGDFWNW